MGAKGLFKGAKGKKAIKVAMAETHGATLVITPAYTENDFRAVMQMITEGSNLAYAFDPIDRRKAVEAMEIMATREPATLGKIIDRILAAPTTVGPIFTLVAYKKSRR